MYAWQLLLSHNLHNIALGILYDVDALLHGRHAHAIEVENTLIKIQSSCNASTKPL